MKKIISLLFIFLFFVFFAKAQTSITIDDLKKHLYVLASDSLEGREPGHEGAKKATKYVLSKYKELGLKLFEESGLDCFSINVGKKVTNSNIFISGNYQAQLKKDYMPFLYSHSGSLLADIVFVGYGIQNETYNDYEKVNVKGKWVMILRGEPNYKDVPLEVSKYDYKVRKALENGASGILFVTPYHQDQPDEIESSEVDFRMNYSDKEIMLLKIKRSVADSLLKMKSLTIKDLTAICDRSDTSCSFDLQRDVKVEVALTDETIKACNIIGFLEGSDSKLKSEFIVVGAHRDHLGTQKKDGNIEIFHGADDNASGTAGLIELAQIFSNLTVKPKRSILFISFDAEEKGLLGSEEFLQSLPSNIQISQIKAMLNLDMIGRYQLGNFEIIGTNSSKEGEELIKKYLKMTSVKAKLPTRSNFFYASDHANFYKNKIPVFFFFTGIHDDYHNVTDTADKIDYEGMKKILDLVYLLVDDLANRDKNLQFKKM